MKITLKILIILLFMLSVEYNVLYADINVINKALNKNAISTSEVFLDPNSSISKTDFKKFSNKNQNQPTQNFYNNSPTIYKNLKIKVNGKTKIIHVPFLNEKFLKKQNLKPIAKRIKEKKSFRSKSAPLRIGDDAADITLMPCPFEHFNFPADETDELKIQAIADVKSIFDKVNSLTWENYGQTMQEIYKLTYEKIFPQYNKYPDLCMITRLYLTESSFKMSPQYYTSGTYLSQAYDQIKNDYDYLIESNVNVKKVLEVINQRKLQMKENNKRLESDVQSQLSYIENYKQNIENTLKIIHPNNDQNEIDQHVKSIAEQYSGMATAYNLIYNNYMLMGDENKAHEIFNFVLKPDGGTEIKGRLFEIYNQIPYEVPFKFKTNNGESQIPVKQYKNADDLLYIMKTFCQLETQNVKNQDFTENTNNFEDKVINHMCKFVEDFQPNESGIPPTAENPKGNAKELIDKAKLEEYHKYAYGWNAYPGTETYYKNKPAITKLYFSRIENVELTSDDIPKPTERITLRADVDYNLPAPLYDFKIAITSNVSGRTKTIIMKKCQYGTSAYYAHFYPNESIVPKEDKINLINNEKDALKESIALFHANYSGSWTSSLINFYDNSFFKYKLGHSDYKSISECNDTNHKVFKDSYSFIKSGGAERISSIIDQKINCEALIRNQANWFLIFGHGNPRTGSVGEKDIYADSVVVRPTQESMELIDGKMTKIDGLIRNDGKSEYSENMNVLILAACDCLYFDDTTMENVLNWHRVLNEGVILGYRGMVYFYEVPYVIDEMNELLKNNPNPNNEQIITSWNEANCKIANGSLWYLGNELKNFAAINGPERKCYYGERFNEVVVSCRYKTYFWGAKNFKF